MQRTYATRRAMTALLMRKLHIPLSLHPREKNVDKKVNVLQHYDSIFICFCLKSAPHSHLTMGFKSYFLLPQLIHPKLHA